MASNMIPGASSTGQTCKCCKGGEYVPAAPSLVVASGIQPISFDGVKTGSSPVPTPTGRIIS